MEGETQYPKSVRGELDKPLALDLEERRPQVEALFGAYKRDCHNIAYRILGNYQDSEDVVQLVFLRVATTPSVFRGESSIRTWLYRMTQNLAKNMYHTNRSHGRSKTDSIEELERDFLSSELNPQQRLSLNELKEDAVRELDHISEVSRKIWTLRYIDEMSYKQIAEVFGCKLGTVRSRLFKAREDLRERVGM